MGCWDNKDELCLCFTHNLCVIICINSLKIVCFTTDRMIQELGRCDLRHLYTCCHLGGKIEKLYNELSRSTW